MKVVIVTGDRNLGKIWPNMPAFQQELALAERRLVFAQLKLLKPDLVIHGGANGADDIADRWADDNRIECRIYPAEWSLYGKSAGPKRNIVMLEAWPEAIVLAFPRGGPGTAHCIREAKKRGMVVYEF